MWCHRRTADQEIYFVAADRASPLRGNLQFRSIGRPEFWDPIDGTTRRIEIFSQSKSHTTVPLDLPAAGSTFLVFRRGGQVSLTMRVQRDGEVLVDAEDKLCVEAGTAPSTIGLTPTDEHQPRVESPLPSFQ